MSDYETWIDELTAQYPDMASSTLKPISKALELQPEYIDNSIALCDILVQLKADEELIQAALLYYIYPDTSATQMSKLASRRVNKLIVGAHNLEQIEVLSQKSNPSREGHTDKLRKMLLAIVDDVRVVVLKLAEQLVRMKMLREASSFEQQAASKIVSEIYAPLANRLGIGQLKWQLEDWAFRYNNPEAYQELKKSLNMRRQDREHYVQNTIDEISQLLDAEHLKQFSISGRAKHIYSIYKKIHRKHVDFEEIYDAIALRVLVHSIEDCYKVLSVVHSRWEHIPQEFDDYVSNPKPNGYRSIHTAVIGPQNKNIEIQIRTQAMHDEAELGVAAHWAYKEGGNATSNYDEKIAWLRQVMAWQQEVSHHQQETENTDANNDLENLFSDRVYVFTPQGDIIDLPEKATPLDFAYYVHSDIGHRCRGAKVNGALVPLTYQLKTGDVVAVQTAKESKPSRDWLNPDNGYLQSSKARSKVAHWFRRQNYDENIEKGQQLWEKLYRAKGLPKNALQDAYPRFNFKSVEGLLAALGSNDISTASLLQHLQSETSETEVDDNESLPASPKLEKRLASSNQRSTVNIAGVDDLLSQLAQCCKPIPGDSIIGYITQGRGVTVHRSDCHNLIHAQQSSPQRIVAAEWGSDTPGNYLVDLNLEATNNDHLIRDITQLISAEKIPLMGIHSQCSRKDDKAMIHLTVEISSLEPLKKFIQKLRDLPAINSIERL